MILDGRTWEMNRRALRREKRERVMLRLLRLGIVVAAFIIGALMF